MSSGHQRITWRRNIAENFNRLSRVHERYRRQTDDRQTDGRRHIANMNISSRSLKTMNKTRCERSESRQYDEMSVASISRNATTVAACKSLNWGTHRHRDGLAYSGSAVVSINEVNLRRARLVLGWVTAYGFN